MRLRYVRIGASVRMQRSLTLNCRSFVRLGCVCEDFRDQPTGERRISSRWVYLVRGNIQEE